MENKRVEMLRTLHECVIDLPSHEATKVQMRALWLNYRDGVGRKLDRKTLTFKRWDDDMK